MTPANDNEWIIGDRYDEVSYRVRTSFANFLRVIRGAGKENAVLNDIEGLASDTRLSYGDFAMRQVDQRAALDGLRAWHPDGEKYDYRAEVEHSLCEAALRLVAAKLDQNKMQESNARIDMWRALNSAWEERDADRKRMRLAEIQSHIDATRVRVDGQTVTAAANDNVISVAPAASCYVYFVTDGEAIKIGKANNPKSRLSGLQTSHHKPLTILAVTPGNETLEREFHRIFDSKRLRGEWFQDCDEVRALVDDINSGRYGSTERLAA